MSRSNASWIVLFGVLAAAGCQSYQDGMKLICDAPTDCGVPCADAMPDTKSMELSRYLEAELSNGDAVELMRHMANVSPQERIEILRAEAEKAGLDGCALADEFEALANTAETP